MTNIRVAFVSAGCPHCREVIMPIEVSNTKMQLKNRINTLDSYEWEHFRMSKNKIFHKLNFEGYPTIFLDGIKISDFMSKEQTSAFLDGFTEKDKIVPDNIKWINKL